MADDDRTGMKQVELSDEEWQKRAEKLAELEDARIKLQAKKATHNKKWNEELIQLKADIALHTEEVNTRTAWVPAQTDMFGEPPANDDDEEPEPAPARRRRGGRRARSEDSVGVV